MWNIDITFEFLLSSKQARDTAEKMIDHLIITKQTGAAGRRVDKVMICERLYSRREYYFAITLDRKYAVSCYTETLVECNGEAGTWLLYSINLMSFFILFLTSYSVHITIFQCVMYEMSPFRGYVTEMILGLWNIPAVIV